MSHHLLQRALVVALHDSAFVAAMHQDPQRVLAMLSQSERADLLALDPRALRTDPLRIRRTLRTLAEEFKVSTTLALAETRSLAFAEAFFGTAFFHEAVLARTPIVLAFGDYLEDSFRQGRLETPQLADVIRLESVAARCLRDQHRAPHPGVALAPGVWSARFDGAVLDCVQAVERYLFELGLLPQIALCDDKPVLPVLPSVGRAEPLFLLFTPQAKRVGLSPIDEGLHAVLATLVTPHPREAALQALVPCGIPAARAGALIDSLLAEGWLAES